MLAKDIIAQGLEIGGNTAITTLAQTFLNSFLDHLYRSHDWDFLLKNGTITLTAGSEVSSALPAQYRAVRKVRLVKSTQMLIQDEYSTLWSLIERDKEHSLTGTPTRFCINPEGTNMLLWPIPQSGTENGQFVYYELPVAITDFNTETPTFPDAYTLINAVADFAATYDRDNVLQIVQRNVDLALGKYVAGGDDIGRSRAQKLKFDPTVYGVWRGDN